MVGHRDLVIRLLLVAILPRQDAPRHQHLPPFHGQLSQVLGGFGLHEIGLRLGERRACLEEVSAGLAYLLVKVGGFYLSQDLARFHAVTDIRVPPEHITVGASVNRRVGNGLDVPRQHEFTGGGRATRFCP